MHLPETALDLMTMHYELKDRHEICVKAKYMADGPSQPALDLPHLVLLKPKKATTGFFLT